MLDPERVAWVLATAAKRAAGVGAGVLPPLGGLWGDVQQFRVQWGEHALGCTVRGEGSRVEVRVEGQLPGSCSWDAVVSELFNVVEYQGRTMQQMIAEGHAVIMVAGNGSRYAFEAAEKAEDAGVNRQASGAVGSPPVPSHNGLGANAKLQDDVPEATEQVADLAASGDRDPQQ